MLVFTACFILLLLFHFCCLPWFFKRSLEWAGSYNCCLCNLSLRSCVPCWGSRSINRSWKDFIERRTQNVFASAGTCGRVCCNVFDGWDRCNDRVVCIADQLKCWQDRQCNALALAVIMSILRTSTTKPTVRVNKDKCRLSHTVDMWR